jgi:hypothetical protein
MRWLVALFRLALPAMLTQLAVGFNVVLRTRMIDYLLRCVTPTALTSGSGAGVAGNITCKLHTADPGANGTTGEVTGGSYAAQNATFNAGSAGASALNADVPFTGMPAVTVTHVSFWDKAGTPLFIGGFALTTPQVIGTAGATFTLTASGTSGSVT